jgi:tetratricopeptide (TPR) repeat protein
MANQRIEALKRLLEIDPNDEVAYFGLGKALMAEEQFAEAADYLEKCIQVKPTYSAAYLALVESLLKIDKKERAKEVCALGHAVSTKNGDMQVTKKIEAIQTTLG